MKTMNRLRRVGILQEYAEPFVSLYYSYGETSYSLFIRNNKYGDKVKTYLVLSVTLAQLVAYLNNEIGLNQIVDAESAPYVAEINRTGQGLVHRQQVDKAHCYEVIKGSEQFDPECCVNYTDILLHLSQKNHLNLSSVK
jgi:hypothetical protein